MSTMTHLQFSKTLVILTFAFAMAATACGPKTTTGPNGNGVEEDDTPKVKEEALKKFKEGIDVAGANPQRARQLFESAVSEDDNFGEAWYNLGLLQDRAGETEAAMESYQNAIDTRPKLGDAYVNLGVIYLEKAKSADDKDEMRAARDKAKEMFLKVVQDDGGVDTFHVQGNLNLGMVYRLEGEELVRDANKDANVSQTMDMGTVSERNYTVPEDAKLKFAEAVRHVRKALAGDSNNITSYENLAAIYYDLDSLEVATLVSEQALQKQGERNEELKIQLAEGKITQAEHDAKMITDQQMAAVHNTYGLIWLARGEVALAFNSFREAVARDGEFTEALLNVAGVAVNVQDYQTAFAIYSQILQRDPKNREAQLSQAVAQRGLGDLQAAEAVYRSMLVDDATFAPAMYNLAILYQEYHRDLEAAKKIYEDFIAMPTAQASGRKGDAEERVKQIEEIWAAQKAAEAEQKKMEEEMRQLEELQKQQEKEYEEAEKAAAEAEGKGAEGAGAEGTDGSEATPEGGAAPEGGGETGPE